MNYLHLIKYKNLALLGLIQIIIRYGFLKQQNIWQSLNDIQFGLLVFATICIAAGYYIINTLFDETFDLYENKITESKAYIIYALCSITGVAVGMYLSNIVQKPGFIALFIFMVALGYFQATTLKDIRIIKLFVKPILASFSLLILAFFDLFPATYDGNREVMSLLFSIIKDYALFVFIIQFIREIISETNLSIELQDNDFQSIANKIGFKKTNYILAILLLIPTVYLVYYSLVYLLNSNLFISIIYVCIAVIAPLGFCAIKVVSASNKKDYTHINSMLKYILVLGVLSIAIITFNILHNA
jgi:4-hydroxybenzoate polyprenyltransferase